MRAGWRTSPAQRVGPCGPSANAGCEVPRPDRKVRNPAIGVPAGTDAMFQGLRAVLRLCARRPEPDAWSSRFRASGSPTGARGGEPCDRASRLRVRPREPRIRSPASRCRTAGRRRWRRTGRRPRSGPRWRRSGPDRRSSPTRRWDFSYIEPGIGLIASVRMKPSTKGLGGPSGGRRGTRRTPTRGCRFFLPPHSEFSYTPARTGPMAEAGRPEDRVRAGQSGRPH